VGTSDGRARERAARETAAEAARERAAAAVAAMGGGGLGTEEGWGWRCTLVGGAVEP